MNRRLLCSVGKCLARETCASDSTWNFPRPALKSSNRMVDGHIPTALLFFSIGVETGHFIFIGFVLSLFALMLRAASKLPSVNQQGLAILELLPPYAIGSVAMFWMIQRIAAFRG